MNRRQFLKLGLAAAALPAVTRFLPPQAPPGERMQGKFVVRDEYGDDWEFKAWGDGKHDDSRNLQRALDFAAAGGVISLAQGTYRMDGPVSIIDKRIQTDDAQLFFPDNGVSGTVIMNSRFEGTPRQERSLFMMPWNTVVRADSSL